MKILITVVLCNALFAVYALPLQSQADIEADLKDRLLAAICALKGKPADNCVEDIRMQKTIRKIISASLRESRLRHLGNGLNGETSEGTGTQISQKQRRQSSFYSNW